MSDLAIRVENLGKKYRIGGRQQGYKRFTETVMETFSAPIRRLKNLGKPTPPEEIIWALKDVSFEVERSEVLGIIGRNGAGKTTLLKILSRITEPTEGRAEIHGRVGSLLEVGTGFHPELTGRENVYLNGAILGMRRAEIDAKFDEIVSFAEIEKFLDTPVKRYSSGMRVRLAFAVAAHLEPEIMLVDEVLAVGDAQFQKKCLGKMGEVAKEGRTVLFVSHNMESVQRLCQTGLVLEWGYVLFTGPVQEAVARYGDVAWKGRPSVEHCRRRAGAGGIRAVRLWVGDAESAPVQVITAGEGMSIYLEASVSPEYQRMRGFAVGFGIDTAMGRRLVTCVSSWVGTDVQTSGQRLLVRCHLPFVHLVPGRYLLSSSIAYGTETLDYVEHGGSFDVAASGDSFARQRNGSHGDIDLPYDFEEIDVH